MNRLGKSVLLAPTDWLNSSMALEVGSDMPCSFEVPGTGIEVDVYSTSDVWNLQALEDVLFECLVGMDHSQRDTVIELKHGTINWTGHIGKIGSVLAQREGQLRGFTWLGPRFSVVAWGSSPQLFSIRWDVVESSRLVDVARDRLVAPNDDRRVIESESIFPFSGGSRIDDSHGPRTSPTEGLWDQEVAGLRMTPVWGENDLYVTDGDGVQTLVVVVENIGRDQAMKFRSVVHCEMETRSDAEHGPTAFLLTSGDVTKIRDSYKVLRTWIGAHRRYAYIFPFKPAGSGVELLRMIKELQQDKASRGGFVPPDLSDDAGTSGQSS